MTALAVCSLQAQDKPLLTIDGEDIYQSEFLYIYEKNNQEATMDPKSLDEYLDLFVNFRLKVHEAEKLGLDTLASFKHEFEGYRAQATPKYMTSPEAEDSVLRMSYDHIARDRRAAHIVVQCSRDASDSAVAVALEKINTLRVRVTTGLPQTVKKGRKEMTVFPGPEDFAAVAMEASEDPGKNETGSDLGWITPFRYVWPLEKAVYATEVGAVSEVFRTNFGFHIVLVEEEREHEEVHARHIMKMTPKGDEEKIQIAKHEIDSIYALLKAGASFEELARVNSDDKGTAARGGDLGFFSRGMMVRPFETAAFALADSGMISEPVKSNFGWHIIMSEGKRGIQSFEEMRADLERKLKRDERNEEVQAAFIRKIRAEYNLPDTLSDAEVLKVEDAHLEEKYPEFAALMKEYHDGILLFDVSLANVWDKAAQDTVGLERYFKSHKADFPWDEPRYKGFVVYCKDKSAMKAAKNIIRSACKDSVESYIEHRLNTDSVKYVRVEYGMWKKGKNAVVDQLGFKQKNVERKDAEQFPYVFLQGEVLKAPEEYLDERGAVTSAYQDALDVEWIKELKAKYPVVLHEEAWQELKKQ